MKTLFIFTIIFLLSLNTQVLTLHFDLSSDHQRCYIEELFKGSVAIIKYKVWSTPNNVEQGNFFIHLNIYIQNFF